MTGNPGRGTSSENVCYHRRKPERTCTKIIASLSRNWEVEKEIIQTFSMCFPHFSITMLYRTYVPTYVHLRTCRLVLRDEGRSESQRAERSPSGGSPFHYSHRSAPWHVAASGAVSDRRLSICSARPRTYPGKGWLLSIVYTPSAHREQAQNQSLDGSMEWAREEENREIGKNRIPTKRRPDSEWDLGVGTPSEFTDLLAWKWEKSARGQGR